MTRVRREGLPGGHAPEHLADVEHSVAVVGDQRADVISSARQRDLDAETAVVDRDAARRVLASLGCDRDLVRQEPAPRLFQLHALHLEPFVRDAR